MEMSELNANSVYPDQTTRSASSDLRLLRLSVCPFYGINIVKYSECTKEI